MDQIEEFVGEPQKASCIHCGEWIAGRINNRRTLFMIRGKLGSRPEETSASEIRRIAGRQGGA